jgi:serine/threonine protein kinase
LGCKGKGRFGEVKVALHKSTGMIVALKVQKKAEILRNHWM